MTTVGTSSWACILSSNITTGTPSGDIIYIFCNKVQRRLNNQDKIKQAGAHINYNIPTLKVQYQVTFQDCKYTATSHTFQYGVNAYHNLLYTAMYTTSAWYCWIKDPLGTMLSFKKGASTNSYFRGIVTEVIDELENSNYQAKTIKIIEST